MVLRLWLREFSTGRGRGQLRGRLAATTIGLHEQTVQGYLRLGWCAQAAEGVMGGAGRTEDGDPSYLSSPVLPAQQPQHTHYALKSKPFRPLAAKNPPIKANEAPAGALRFSADTRTCLALCREPARLNCRAKGSATIHARIAHCRRHCCTGGRPPLPAAAAAAAGAAACTAVPPLPPKPLHKLPPPLCLTSTACWSAGAACCQRPSGEQGGAGRRGG